MSVQKDFIPQQLPPKQIQKIHGKNTEHLFSFPIVYALPSQTPYIIKMNERRLKLAEIAKNYPTNDENTVGK